MNHIFRLVWNSSNSQLVPVCEFGGRSRPGRSRRRNAARAAGAAALLLTELGFSGYLQAGPTGGQVTTGSGQISQSGTTTTINQNSQRLGLDWQSFNVAANETVNFVQPGSSAIAVNRILSSSGSEILGHVNANGQVWLINPNGILFGSNAQVNVGGLVASTLAPTDAGSAGTASFSGSGTGSIVNQGSVTAAKGGYVALLGKSVSNQGIVSAQLGTVALGAGSAATLTFAGNKLLQIQVDQSTLGNLAENKGLIAADGGAVYMTAGSKNSLLASSVNTTGVIRASTLENHDGTVVLSAGLPTGEVTVEGVVDVSASHAVGGEVTATAGQVTVGAGAKINASGSAGGGDIRIGGGWEGGEGIAQATAVSVASTAMIDASATNRGNGGEIVVRSDVTSANSTARVYGTLLAEGGAQGGDGGRIETSGHWLDVTGIKAQTAAPSGAAGLWLLDPYNITIGATGTGVSSGGGTYTPTADSTITASSIATALQNGNNVTISTYNAGGGSIGDITVASAINKTSGNGDVTLTLQAADSIVINAPISNTGGTGKLNVNLYADNDNGTHDGVGVVILNNSITTGGGSIAFGTGATQSVNSVLTQVGGDVYVGGSSAVNLTTAGGNVSINGALIIANTNGLNIDTTNGVGTAGNVLFNSTIDSGDTYGLVSSFGSVTWTAALADAKSGVGSATGDTYLATITSRLENAVASYDVGYLQSWLGAERVFGLGTDAQWRWVAGPEGLSNNGNGLPFFTQNGCLTNNCSPGHTGFNGGTAINGAYINWNPSTPEPNNYNGTSLNQAGSSEWALQFVGTQGQWNDLNPGTNSLPFTKETNLAPSPLTVNAGATGTVTFTGGIGSNKPLSTLTVTGQILGLPADPHITTTGPVNFNGQVQINNVDYDVLVVTAPSVTTTYGATLPTLTPTYSGFVNGDTVASLTTPATATTTGSTNYVSTAPITASGAADTTNPTRYFFLYDPGLLTVNPAPLTVVGTSVTPRAYNGLTNATLSGGTLAGLFSGDIGNVLLTQSGSFASKNAGVGIPLTVTDSISGSAAADYTLTEPTNVTGTITPLALTVTGSTVTPKTYNGTTVATLTGGVLNGVLAADQAYVSLSAQSGSFASKNAGVGIGVTAADTITATGTAAGDYTVTQPTGLMGTITPLALTVTGTAVTPKTYDGTTTATLAGGVLSGVLTADQSFVSLASQAGTFSSKNAGTGIGVTAADTITATGSAAGDYTLTQPTGLTGTITPLALTVTGTAVTPKTYDGTTAATIAGGALSGVLTADQNFVSLASQSGSFVSKNAGSSVAVTVTDAITATGTAAGDYTLIQPTNVTGTITPLAITVTGSSVTPKTYDGTTTATLAGGALSGVLTADQSFVSLASQAGTFSSKNAGTGIGVTAADTLAATGSASGDYTLTQPTGLTGTITPLALTVTGSTVTPKTYDGTTAATLTGGALSGVLTADQAYVSLSAQSGSFASKNAGTGIGVTAADTLAATGSASGDYTLTQPTGLTGTITPLALTVTGSTVTPKTYDGTTVATLTSGVLNGVLAADQAYVSLSAQSGSFASKNAGSGIGVTAADTITATGTAAGDYTVTQPTGLMGTITPLALTVTGTAVTPKTYDGTTTATLAGGVLSGVLTADQSFVSLASQAGTFSSKNAGTGIGVTAADTITATGSAAGDYTLTQPTGLTGTITPLALTVTGTAVTPKTYDGTTAATIAGGALSGVLTADQNFVSLASQSGSFVSKNAGSSVAVTVTDAITATGTAAGDYTLIQPTNVTGTITPLAITVTGSSVTPKTYDGTTTATLAGGALSGVLTADQSFVSLASQAGTFSSKNAGTGIGVTAADTLAATGSASGDYTLTQPTGLTGTITPRTVTFGANETAASKTYDGTTAATLSGGPLNNVLPGDSSGLSLVGAFASPNAGQHIAVSAALSGPDAGNYVLGGTPSLAADIDPAPLLATATPVSTPMGGVLPVLSGTFTGFVAGQTLAALEAAGYRASWTSTASAKSAAGLYGISGTFDDANYQVVQAAGNATASDLTAVVSSSTTSAGSVIATIGSVPAASGGGLSGLPGSTSSAGYSNGSAVAGEGGNGNGTADAGDAATAAAAGNSSGSAADGDTNRNANSASSVLATIGNVPAASGGGLFGEPGASSGSNGSGMAGNAGDVTGAANGSGSAAGSGGTNGNLLGMPTGLSLGADSTNTASDGTVTLTATADGGAGASAAGNGTSPSGTNANSGDNPASGLREASLLDFGGRRLIVVRGGVNANVAR